MVVFKVWKIKNFSCHGIIFNFIGEKILCFQGLILITLRLCDN